MLISKVYIIIFAFFVGLSTSQADRMGFNWMDLIEDSDFIVKAKISKLEETPQGHVRTSFTVYDIYKGKPPTVVAVEWSLGIEDSISTLDGLRDHYFLFGKKTRRGYSLVQERFMKMQNDGYIDPKSFFHLNQQSIPEDLKEKMNVVDKEFSFRGTMYKSKEIKLKCVDLANWIQKYFSRRANKGIPLNSSE